MLLFDLLLFDMGIASLLIFIILYILNHIICGENLMNNEKLSQEFFLKSIEDILKEILGITELWVNLTMDTSLVFGVGENSLDLASIDFVDLIVKVENEYNVTFEFDAAIYTLQDLYNYIIEDTEGRRID